MPGRRSAAEWGRPADPVQPVLDVLIPTVARTSELAVTLAGLAAQDDPLFGVTISDQSDDGRGLADAAVQAMIRVLRAQGRPVETVSHRPRRGVAEHRQFLLDRSTAEYVLFLDDDVWLEPGQLRLLMEAIAALGCGFVGCAVQGLSFLDDVRPHEHRSFQPWSGAVAPERVRRDSPAFERWRLHNAANLVHIAAGLPDPPRWLAYKIAWVGGCVLYRRQALIDTGGFEFWGDLPSEHSGEDVAAQWRVMERFGGAGILPSGAVHLESETTVPVRLLDAFDVVFA